jgi:hypothetical protein
VPERIRVFNSDGVIIERVDQSRLAQLIDAPNVTVVRLPARKGGGILRLVLNDLGDDSKKDFRRANPRALSHKNETRQNPPRCWTLKRIHSSTAGIFRAVLVDLTA